VQDAPEETQIPDKPRVIEVHLSPDPGDDLGAGFFFHEDRHGVPGHHVEQEKDHESDTQ